MSVSVLIKQCRRVIIEICDNYENKLFCKNVYRIFNGFRDPVMQPISIKICKINGGERFVEIGE